MEGLLNSCHQVQEYAMKYVIVFGAICVGLGLIATFWLWWYAERSIGLRASSASFTEDNSIAQPLLPEENGRRSASQPQQEEDTHPVEVVTHSVAAPTAVSDAGAAGASGVDKHEEEQRKDSDSRSSSSSRKSSPQMAEALVGETTLEGDKGQETSLDSLAATRPPQDSKTPSAAPEKQKQQESSSSSPVARVDENGDRDEDPPVGKEGNTCSAGADAEELGETREC